MATARGTEDRGRGAARGEGAPQAERHERGDGPPRGNNMAARATWKGFLRVSLVNIPVKVFPATESSATISFNQLHAECQTRIQQKRWCPTCNKEVAHADIAKGYEFEKGRYVIISEDDIDKVRPTSTRIIDLVQFDEATALDPMYVDRTYYLAPDGQVAADAFAVMREGMKGKIGVGKLALYGREYLVAVKPHDKGLVMYTLHHAAEIRGMGSIEELSAIPSKVKPQEVQLAKQVIGTFEKKLDLSDYRDEYREGLQKIIDAKIAGEEVVAPSEEMPPKVVNLMEALRKSLDSASAQKKNAAKAQLPKKAAGRAEPKKKRAG
jgi:DNA end-binding protein Ku